MFIEYPRSTIHRWSISGDCGVNCGMNFPLCITFLYILLDINQLNEVIDVFYLSLPSLIVNKRTGATDFVAPVFLLYWQICIPLQTIIMIMYKDYPDKMTPEQARRFCNDVLNIVAQIPYGHVTTYGTVAAWAGWPSHSRMVGRTLRYTPGTEQLPCHRVVNKEGRTAPGWSKQRTLLEEEGVTFKPNGRVDMHRHQWEPDFHI